MKLVKIAPMILLRYLLETKAIYQGYHYSSIFFHINRREVNIEIAEKFIQERNIDLFFETSALKNENIDQVMNLYT